MSLETISNSFEVLHRTIAERLSLSTSQGDLLLTVAFAFLCELLKRMCNTINVKLGYGSLEKFREVVYKILIRIWLTFYSTLLCLSKDYFWDPTLYWRYPSGALRGNDCTRDIQIDERIYYVTLCGYYLNHTITQFNDPRREDFYALCAHHLITLCLIMMSYKSGLASIGVVVAMCHEPSDLLLAIAKMFRYLGMTFTTDVLFGIFTFSWFYFRIYLYPLKCIMSTVASPVKMSFHKFVPFFLDDPPNCVNQTSEFLLYLMISLYILHVYWTFYLVKALYRKVATGKTEDTRSGTERIPQGGVKLD